ncbi:MAG: AAA family ATPase [Chlamydiales bacterium]|nr:AAA family ATPase [Chlamydiales bacterium]
MSEEGMEARPIDDRDGRTIVRKAGLEDLAARFDPVKIYRGILRRLWLVFATSILFAFGFGFFGQYLQSIYVADSYLMFETGSDRTLPEGFPLGHFTMASAVEMVTLPAHLNAVRSILGLELTEQQLLKMIDVKPPMGDSNLINIQVSADNPSLAMDIANTLATVVVKDAQDFAKRQLKAAYDYLSAQSQSTRDKIDQKIQEIATFRKEHPFMEVTPDGLVVTRGIQDTEKRLQDATASYNALLIEFENLRREAARLPDQIVSKQAVEDSPLKRRLAQTELALLEAKSRYAPENPKIKVLEAEMRELQTMLSKPNTDDQSGSNASGYQQYEKNPIKDQLNLDLVGLRGKVRSSQKLREDLEIAYARQQDQTSNLPADELQFARMTDQKFRDEENLKQTESVLKVAEMMLKLGKGDIDVYVNATRAEPADSILIDLLPLLGFLVGIGFGLSFAAFLEVIDNKLRTPQEVERSYNVPCMLTIPEMSGLNNRVVEERLRFYVSHLESALSRHLPKDAHFSLAVTSSVAGEGKSTLTYCLARYWEKLGKSVVILNLDPVSSILFNDTAQPAKSIEEFLLGRANIDEVIATGPVPHLNVDATHDLKALLRTGNTSQLMQKLRERYDIILIDVPGIVDRDYATAALELADQVLFVVGSNKVTRRFVDTSLHECEIADIWPVGIVLNRALKIFVDDVHVQVESKRARASSSVFSRMGSLFSRKK